VEQNTALGNDEEEERTRARLERTRAIAKENEYKEEIKQL
jgi:hypothetical protein